MFEKFNKFIYNLIWGKYIDYKRKKWDKEQEKIEKCNHKHWPLFCKECPSLCEECRVVNNLKYEQRQNSSRSDDK